LRKFEIISV